MHDNDYKATRQYALKRLSAQSYHSVLLRKLLLRKGFMPEIIDKVIDEYRALGFINDEHWVENFIRSRQSRYGISLVVAQLRMKGITVEKLPEDCGKNDEVEAISKLLKGRYRNKDLQNFQDKQKIIASLMRKGFTWDSIQAALKS